MAKIIIYPGEQERNALHHLAQREKRVPRAQAAHMICQELNRLGMLSTAAETLNVEAVRTEDLGEPGMNTEITMKLWDFPIQGIQMNFIWLSQEQVARLNGGGHE